jgi:O-antigen/teichoic acid export membrane protein
MNKKPESLDGNNQTIHEVRKFTGDTLWMALALGIQTVLGLAILPILTRTFHTELYGVYIQIMTTVGIIYPLLTMGLDLSYIRFMGGEKETKKIQAALGTILWPVLVVGCLLIILSLFVRNSLSLTIFANSSFAYFVPFILIWALAQALFIFSLCYYKAYRAIKRVAIVQIICTVFQATATSVLALSGIGLLWIIVVNVVIQIIFTSVNLASIVVKTGFPTFHFQVLKKYLGFGTPLILSGLLLWVMTSSDNYFITHILSVSQTGVYSVSKSLANISLFFLTPIAYNTFYTISGLWDKGEIAQVKYYLEYSAKLFLTLAIPTAAGLTMLSQPLLKIIVTSEFLSGRGLVFLIALGTIFFGIYQINVYVIFLVQKTKWVPLIVALSALTSAGLNALLIPKIGIIGAGISNMASFFILAAIVSVWAKKTISVSFDMIYLSKVIISSFLMVLCLYFIKQDGVATIFLAILAGTFTFGISLFLLRALSKQDKALIRRIVSGLVPRSH